MTTIARTARRFRLTAPLLAALAACDDNSPTETVRPDTGVLSFSYQGSGAAGSVAGTYQAEGYPRQGSDLTRQTYAHGHRYPGAQALEAVSNVARGDVFDFTWVTIPRLTVGSSAIDPFCGTDHCPEVFVALEIPQVNGAQARYSCRLESGIVRIVSIADGRARGEFSGSGICGGRPGVADLEEFTVTNGHFDVKVRDAQG